MSTNLDPKDVEILQQLDALHVALLGTSNPPSLLPLKMMKHNVLQCLRESYGSIVASRGLETFPPELLHDWEAENHGKPIER